MTANLIAQAPKQKEPLFIGLKAYSEDQAEMFFGREEEIKTLYKLIKSNTITIVFGKSGTGKTSLLNAGVFPKLREIYCLPFRIRLEFNDHSDNLITQIKQVLRTEIDKYEFHVESYPTTETLWEYFHKEPLWKIITPVLIFDQFEEIFTLANKSNRFKRQELDLLVDELSDLVENSIPDKLKNEFIDGKEVLDFNYDKQKAKIIFSFREDFLAEIESLTVKIPSVKNSRFRLKPMHGQQAFDVITKTWKKAIDPTEANKIVYFLTSETETENVDVESRYGKYDMIEIEPSLLSQVCDYIERERIKEGREKISADFLQHHPKDQILRSLYNSALDESNAAVEVTKENSDRNVLKEFIEDHLITDEGYRTKYAIKEINKNIWPGVEHLEKKYFLREESNSIELTHDVIVTLVKTDREERRKKIALGIERKKAKKKMRLIVLFVFVAATAIGAVSYRSITNEANIAKEEAIKQTNNIQAKNAVLRNDSLQLEKFLAKHKPGDSSKKEIIIKNSPLVDSITVLNNLLFSLNQNFINSSKSYNDSIHSLQIKMVGYTKSATDLQDSLASLLKENNDLRFQLNEKKLAMAVNNEKWYQSKINFLEQQIARIQRSRDSLAAIVANTLPPPVFIDDNKTIDSKKKIFGYGYDYHNLKNLRKN